jgi:hypothetical protein
MNFAVNIYKRGYKIKIHFEVTAKAMTWCHLNVTPKADRLSFKYVFQVITSFKTQSLVQQSSSELIKMRIMCTF